MKKVIDARGLDCPKPVLRTKKALEQGGFDKLEILVDNKAARDNISSFLEKSGQKIDQVKETIGDFTIYATIKKAETIVPRQNEAASTAGKTVFISSDSLGIGSDDLGRKLMKAFTFTLTELDTPPNRLLFMNSGVYLCLNDSDSLPNLKILADRGTDILVCGTCLNFFGVSEKLAIGKVSNMYDIADHLLKDEGVIKI
ncbi:MAG: sulfurtransferase-like selenium metabolism protein YedF [Candidatus Stygibacter australis]|nr:sulfurtransferase-like selenium metabolism protein YedF [Candidatus Stygibacter australis]MDP8322319.1 sulfurtransferase-like selenium metabolism protein YedF [Candidatus Stygibacter australis]